MFNISESWGFSGVLVATSLTSAAKLTTYPCSQDKYFYVWNPEWMMGNNRPHSYFKSIYSNPQLKLIARNELYKKAIENCWNHLVTGCLDDFNLDELINIIENNTLAKI